MTAMASPASSALLPSAPVGHHPPPISTSPANNSPPPAATSTSSSPTPPAVAHPALLHPFRPDLLLPLPNGGTTSINAIKKTSVVPTISAGKPAYATPSPVENTPQNNECKLVEVKGAKLASFTVKDAELICLPQAFDLFLKHLVGGLHTVYTKLKRLDITPVVCNVEQVRVLRGLGAIQPGVNRCKLISIKDFEVLYNDCTNASSRPGRPPKRLQSVTSSECGSHMVSHSGLMSAGMMPPAGLSALAKKIKLEVMSGYHGSQRHGGPNGENGDHNPGLGLDQLPFMMISHPLIPASLGQASVSMAMGQMNRLSTLASMANAAQLHHHASHQASHQASLQARLPASVIKERVRDSPSPSASLDDAQVSSNQDSSVSSSPIHMDRTGEATHLHFDGLSANLSVLGHSPGLGPGSRGTDLAALEYSFKDSKRNQAERDPGSMTNVTGREDRQSYQAQRLVLGGCERNVYPSGQKFQAGLNAPFIFPEGLSSIETLLTNIQGLLRVAIENARAQEKQDQLERTELKMELVRERELRETLERQLSVEQKNRVLIQKRLKKEKRSKRRLQEALEEEVKLRDQAETSLMHAGDTPTDLLTQEVDGSNHDDNRLDSNAMVHGTDSRVFLHATGMY
ncbi:dachshund c isoform X2 [Gadus chalcogrammus]|uniref:dachshund c isoform X2 n=1 Tax=Gadus chalcogrammus TaxID=1042646 RepID=UPI0024C4AC68|nr:dachshund c isoform X2 [Gadus chalcogrammus]